MLGFVLAQLEFSAEDEEVHIVPSFQVQNPVHDDMLIIAAVRFGPCPLQAQAADSWGEREMGSPIWALSKSVAAGDLWAVQAKPGHAGAVVDGADAAQAEEVPHKSARLDVRCTAGGCAPAVSVLHIQVPREGCKGCASTQTC